MVLVPMQMDLDRAVIPAGRKPREQTPWHSEEVPTELGIEREPDRQAALDILRSLRGILRHITTHSRKLARETGLTLPQVACLRALGDAPSGEATIAELARAIELSSPTVTGLVDRLERRGLALRSRGTRDRRKVFVSLTETGHERVNSLPHHTQETFFAALMSLDPKERADLRASLERIAELMETEVGFEPAPYLDTGESLD